MASERLVYPSVLMSVSYCLRRGGSIDTPKRVIFSMVARINYNRGTNLIFLLPKTIKKTIIFHPYNPRVLGKNMWLVTTIIAALVTTAAWYFSIKDYKLDILSLMLWGTSIMILVDHLLGYEGGAFFELETEGLITNSTLLGIVMLIPIFIVWILVLVLTRPKGKNAIGGN